MLPVGRAPISPGRGTAHALLLSGPVGRGAGPNVYTGSRVQGNSAS
jgi:hypothetical protein